MFKKSQNNQGSIFSGISTHVSQRKQKLLDDPNSWHHVFYKEIISRIDESVYSVLYCEDNGRPNASIRVLVGMMILKEGNGWSDEQLFEECRFNLKVMLALGYMNIDADVPVESTYYAFRNLLTSYNEEFGDDLVKKSFHQITKEQLSAYQVSGKKVRLDSKLINSNIKLCTRIDLILETVRVFTNGLTISKIEKSIGEKEYEILLTLQKKTTTNVTYNLDKDQKKSLLKKFGRVIKVLLKEYKGQPNYEHLERLYKDHYKEVGIKEQQKSRDGGHGCDDTKEEDPELKEGKELSSSSLQSIHDPDATFRAKGKDQKQQYISGFHANITETCDESNDINLIIDTQVSQANMNEDEFLLEAIESSEKLLQDAKLLKEEEANPIVSQKIIGQATTDGGYDSIKNREAMSAPDFPHWNMGKNKGKKQRFHMSYDEDGNLQVIEKETGEKCEVGRNRKGDKVVIKFPTSKKQNKQYFTDAQIKSYILLQNILGNLREEDKSLRANVEATIHQVFHRLLKRNKIKYRGKYKCNMYVIGRALWTNFRRIHKKVSQIATFFAFLTLSALVGYQVLKNEITINPE
jgi:hypothetical protein